MTPSTYIKSQGLPSTAYVAEKVGKPVQTINNWYHNNFPLFEAVVAGVMWSNLDDVKIDRSSVGQMLQKIYEREKIE